MIMMSERSLRLQRCMSKVAHLLLTTDVSYNTKNGWDINCILRNKIKQSNDNNMYIILRDDPTAWSQNQCLLNKSTWYSAVGLCIPRCYCTLYVHNLQTNV